MRPNGTWPTVCGVERWQAVKQRYERHDAINTPAAEQDPAPRCCSYRLAISFWSPMAGAWSSRELFVVCTRVTTGAPARLESMSAEAYVVRKDTRLALRACTALQEVNLQRDRQRCAALRGEYARFPRKRERIYRVSGPSRCGAQRVLPGLRTADRTTRLVENNRHRSPCCATILRCGVVAQDREQ
jgi:hypothetical protein